MKVLVVGAGGIGGYFGGRLSLSSKIDLSIVAHSHCDYIRENGLKVNSIKGNFEPIISQVLPIAPCNEEFDVVILTTKALKSIDQVALLKNFVNSSSTSIMIIQNGIDTELEIAKAFPENEVISTVAYIGVCKENKNVIQHTGGDGVLQLGLVNRDALSDKFFNLIAEWRAQDVNATFIENLRQKRYEKLMWNVPFNCIGVLGGDILTDEMTDRGDIEELCINLMKEIIQIAKSDNIVIPDETIDEKIEYTRNFPPYASSMLVDFQNGRELEVDAIVGNILKIAKRNGIDTPYIKTIYTLLASVNKQLLKNR